VIEDLLGRRHRVGPIRRTVVHRVVLDRRLARFIDRGIAVQVAGEVAMPRAGAQEVEHGAEHRVLLEVIFAALLHPALDLRGAADQVERHLRVAPGRAQADRLGGGVVRRPGDVGEVVDVGDVELGPAIALKRSRSGAAVTRAATPAATSAASDTSALIAESSAAGRARRRGSSLVNAALPRSASRSPAVG